MRKLAFSEMKKIRMQERGEYSQELEKEREREEGEGRSKERLRNDEI